MKITTPTPPEIELHWTLPNKTAVNIRVGLWCDQEYQEQVIQFFAHLEEAGNKWIEGQP